MGELDISGESESGVASTPSENGLSANTGNIQPRLDTGGSIQNESPSRKDRIKQRLDNLFNGLRLRGKVAVIGSMMITIKAIEDGFREAEIEPTSQQLKVIAQLKEDIQAYAISQGLLPEKTKVAKEEEH